jgi:hypothetical protein
VYGRVGAAQAFHAVDTGDRAAKLRHYAALASTFSRRAARTGESKASDIRIKAS